MPDGSSGLSLSEIGISAVKKTVKVVQKVSGPVAKQVKHQVGGTFIPSQTQNSQPPSEVIAAMGGNDIGAMFGEKNMSTNPAKQVTGQMQNTQNSTVFDQQHQSDQQQIANLRRKLHDMYFEDFKNKAEGTGGQQQEKQKRQEMQQQEEEEKKNQKEQSMESISMTQSPKKGFGKKVKSSLMNMIKPKQGSHEGKSSKG